MLVRTSVGRLAEFGQTFVVLHLSTCGYSTTRLQLRTYQVLVSVFDFLLFDMFATLLHVPFVGHVTGVYVWPIVVTFFHV